MHFMVNPIYIIHTFLIKTFFIIVTWFGMGSKRPMKTNILIRLDTEIWAMACICIYIDCIKIVLFIYQGVSVCPSTSLFPLLLYESITTFHFDWKVSYDIFKSHRKIGNFINGNCPMTMFRIPSLEVWELKKKNSVPPHVLTFLRNFATQNRIQFGLLTQLYLSPFGEVSIIFQKNFSPC